MRYIIMKLIYTFYMDNEGEVIKADTKAIVHGKVFDCNLCEHFSRYEYIMTKVEKRPTYKYLEGAEFKEANIKVHTSEA